MRVLFVTTRIGFGHLKVSNTLASYLKNILPSCETKTVTYFDFFPQSFQKIINRIYIYTLRVFPKVFGYIYITQKRYKGGGVEFWTRFLGRKYARTISTYSPDLIVITQGLACQWLGRLKKRGLVDCSLAAIITDFIVHPFWVHPEINLYLVATEHMKEDLVSRGISKDGIEITGIPIDPKFTNRYNISKNRLTVFIMGGGWGLGRIDRLLAVIDKMPDSLELLVVTGRNRELYRRLKKMKFRMPVHIYGLVDNISDLMAASDIIITKAGGVTVSELAASGLPAILWDIIPGQEEMNAEFIVKAGAAIRIDNIMDVRDAINKVISSREKMAKCSKDLGRPNSTVDAVRYMRELVHV